jgi:molybdopterin-guanine dinucleotide biosynthesis protein A
VEDIMKTIKPPCMILAGGRSSRMGGGDKGLLRLDRQPMLAHVIARIRPQVSKIAINANGDGGRFRQFDLPVMPDTIAGLPGPLAGILAGLIWARSLCPQASHILTVPCDTPLLPHDLVHRLCGKLEQSGAEVAVARDIDTIHPVIGLWSVALTERLRHAVTKDGVRSVHRFLERCRTDEVIFENADFRNINTLDDLNKAARDLCEAAA